MRIMTCILMGAMVLGLSTSGGTEPVPIGLQKQLLVDDYIIAEKHNIIRELGKVRKHGIVVEPTLRLTSSHRKVSAAAITTKRR